MKALCLGFSSIARRRVLAAISSLPAIEATELASRRGAPPAATVPVELARVWDDFEDALTHSSADWVYVSTVNSEHGVWARRALERGFHVVVDKPAFLSLEEAVELTDLARRKQCVLAEATVYLAHPQVELCRRAFSEIGSVPRRISAILSMPSLAETDFRYRRAQGGGALWDLGPYAVSLGRAFLGGEPQEMACTLNSRGGPDRVETAFSMLARYSGGRSVVGHFGFDTEYRNEITVLGERLALSAERFFTTPEDLENRIRIRHENTSQDRTAPAGDSFACFLSSFAEASASPGGPEARRFSENLLIDARALRALRESVQE